MIFFYRIKYFQLYILGFFFFVLNSCNRVPLKVEQALGLAGDNRVELEAVINNYQSPSDSLKLKAAYFLIENMVSQYHVELNEGQQHFINDTYKELSIYPGSLYEMKKWFTYMDSIKGIWTPKLESKWDSIKKTNSFYGNNEIFDIRMISRDLLIENIDEAFNSWETSPWYNNISFDRFCRSILPYRAKNDIPAQNRKKHVSYFSEFKKSNIIESSEAFQKKLYHYFLYLKTFKQFSHLKVEDVFKVRNVTCRQMNSVKIAALRSIGIPANEVFAVDGTSWIRVEDENGKVYDWDWDQELTSKETSATINQYRRENSAKVYMQSFEIQTNKFVDIPFEDIPPLLRSRNILDVSKDHLITFNPSIELKYKPSTDTDVVYLCVFNTEKLAWEAVDFGYIDNHSVNFKDIGVKRIYYPAYYKNGSYKPAAEPFYLKDGGDVKLLTASDIKEKTALKKKFPWDYNENCYAMLSLGWKFQAANNPNFNNAKTLYTITKEPRYFEELLLNSQEKYRYYRVIIDDIVQKQIKRLPVENRMLGDRQGMHIAELVFLDPFGTKIKGRPISNENQSKSKHAFDGDIRTYFDCASQSSWIGLDAGKPVTVSKIKYLIRNSFNTIEPNDTYELFYWDKEWKSLGVKKAEQDFLEYDIPKNAVLWLRNLTKGKQEMIFYMKNGEQIWG